VTFPRAAHRRAVPSAGNAMIDINPIKTNTMTVSTNV
jgi:hypothetical protein